MKYILYPLSILLILASCKSEPEEVTAERLVGEFVRVKDNGRVGESQKDAPLITNITFRSQFCNFSYDGSPMSGKYTVDEGYVYIEAGGDLGTLSLEVITANQLEGEGLINGSYMREGFEGEYEYIKDKGNWSGGGSSGTNGGNSSSNAGGSGGDSNSDGANSGNSLDDPKKLQESSNTSGNNTGSNTTKAEPEKEKRMVIKHVSTAGVRAPGPTTVAFFVTVDPRGDVIAVKLDKSRTTTNNEVLVNSITTKVKNELKYNKISGTDYMKMSYLVKL